MQLSPLTSLYVVLYNNLYYILHMHIVTITMYYF